MLKNLALVSETEQKKFLISFDAVISDLDGVVFYVFKKMPGSSECIKKLRKLGKPVHFLTNNTLKTSDNVFDDLAKSDLIENKYDLTVSYEALFDYLEKINFHKKIYLIGGHGFCAELENRGFRVELHEEPHSLKIDQFISHLKDDEDIGAVVIDNDLHYTFLKLQKTLTYLARPDCLLFNGAPDLHTAYAVGKFIIGAKHVQDVVEEISGRKGIGYTKPSDLLKERIFKKYQIKDPSRYLFIGDTIPSDMQFAAHCQFKKLLVLSGNTKTDQIENWDYPEEWKPDYYIGSLDDLNTILSKLNFDDFL